MNWGLVISASIFWIGVIAAAVMWHDPFMLLLSLCGVGAVNLSQVPVIARRGPFVSAALPFLVGASVVLHVALLAR